MNATGIRPTGATHTRRNGVITAGLLLGVAVMAIVALWPRAGTPGFTGLIVTVPACPPDVDGCRVFVTNEGDGSLAAHKDWTGRPVAVSIALSPGRYSISAEGCTGDRIGDSVVTVASGYHAALELGSSWQMPAFVGRICPGFLATASQ
ncbi:MAG: hypothetical protein WAL77_04105 [Candidatus Dormiibacterota bacterium]